MVSMAAYGVFDSIGKFSDFICTDYLPIGQMHIGRFGRIFDLEGKRKWNLGLSWVTQKSAY